MLIGCKTALHLRFVASQDAKQYIYEKKGSMSKLLLSDLNFRDKCVLVRVDFNVPLNEKGEITDATRIRKCLPTIETILMRGGKVILMSHLGRPKGKRDPKFSLTPCYEALKKLLPCEVFFSPDCIGKEAETLASRLQTSQVLLLENLRFHAAEEKPDTDPTFAKQLAKLGDLYVNDAFGAAHRKHSSTATITQYFPNCAGMGLLMEAEVRFLTQILSEPKRPFYALIGGAKISSKIGVLTSLLQKVDELFIGGGMAYTFLKAQGINIGSSLVENDLVPTAKDILNSSAQKNITLHLPEDLVIADRFANDASKKTIAVSDGIPQKWEGMDIGPKTAQKWSKEFEKCATFFWNGPVGVFEFPNFAKGTHVIAKALAENPATTIVGGGDSLAAVNQLGISQKFSHISTGGGASLEFIEFGHLPGIDTLSNKN